MFYVIQEEMDIFLFISYTRFHASTFYLHTFLISSFKKYIPYVNNI